MQSAYIQTSLPSDAIPTISPSPHFCKTISGPENEWGSSLIQTSDGGYAIAVETTSFGLDVYVVKLDKNGNACCAVSQTSQVGSGGTLGSPTPSIASGGTLTSPTSRISSGGTLTNQCP
jgi:hypothetical protein